jgi:hypothetical protein
MSLGVMWLVNHFRVSLLAPCNLVVCAYPWFLFFSADIWPEQTRSYSFQKMSGLIRLIAMKDGSLTAAPTAFRGGFVGCRMNVAMKEELNLLASDYASAHEAEQ